MFLWIKNKIKKKHKCEESPKKIFQLNSENENFQSKQDINFVFMFQYIQALYMCISEKWRESVKY